MKLSGGQLDLRAPHNILLNTWARLGLIGLILHAALLLLGLLAAVTTTVRRLTPRIVWALVLVAFPIVALVGVILESPFGAIPYAFALGMAARATAAHKVDAYAPDSESATLSLNHA